MLEKLLNFKVIREFFEPKSVAIIGASEDKNSVGYSLMKNMSKFHGEIIPVNIKKEEILGKKCYKSVLAYKDKIELAVIAVPALVVSKVLTECGKKKIKSVIIISSGFSEIGNKKLENKLKLIAKKYKIRVIGPNCFGSVNPYIKLDTSFALSSPEKGSIAFIAQSGALWVYLVEYSKGKFGFSGYAGLGNMLDVDFSDCIEYFCNDINTKAIVCYIETLKDGRKFIDICRKCKKPVIAVKVGRGEVSSKAALSHTGSLAGSFEIYKAAFKQAGVRLAEDLREAMDKAELLSKQEISGNKVVIVTNGGGSGVMAADLLEENKLDVVELNKNFINQLRLPDEWSKRNPIDIVGDANYDRYKEVFSNLAKESFYDVAFIIISQQKMVDIEKTALEVAEFKKNSDKTIVCVLMGGSEVKIAERILRENNISCFFDIKRAVEALRGI